MASARSPAKQAVRAKKRGGPWGRTEGEEAGQRLAGPARKGVRPSEWANRPKGEREIVFPFHFLF